MTENEQANRPSAETKPEPRPRGVIDPDWEAELRSGQESEGEAGSVDAELAVLHLLRHVRQPDTLEPEQLDSLWSAIEAEVAPVGSPWWRKAWLWWSAPALAAVAVLAVIIIQDPERAEDSVARADERKAESEQAPAAAPAPASAAEPELAEGGIGRSGGTRMAKSEDQGASAGLDSKSAKQGNAFESSFEELAPHGRRAIRGSVDTSLDALRGQLLADARGASQ